MVRRVEIGRFRFREIGPSVGFARERRSMVRAERRSSGVSMSCHHAPRGSATTRRGRSCVSSVMAPASE